MLLFNSKQGERRTDGVAAGPPAQLGAAGTPHHALNASSAGPTIPTPAGVHPGAAPPCARPPYLSTSTPARASDSSKGDEREGESARAVARSSGMLGPLGGVSGDEPPESPDSSGSPGTQTGSRGGAASAGTPPPPPASPPGAAESSPEPPDPLRPNHAQMLRESAIADGVQRERGYRTITTKAEVKQLGFTERQARVPALMIPLHDVHGEIASYQTRPDMPRVNKRGKAVKYETPSGSRMVLDVPPRCRAWIRDPSRPLFITEGVKKADAGASRDLCCVALIGVWNWRGRNDAGGLTALDAWELIALNGRDVLIVFDSDVVTKQSVFLAMRRLKAFLEGRKANVKIVYLPAAEGGAKVGMDDYFAAGHTTDDLLRCASDKLIAPPGAGADQGPYDFAEDGIYLLAGSADERRRIQLTNFTAEIVREVTLDDGVEHQKEYGISATIGSHVVRFDLTARQLTDMRWPTEYVGRGATFFPERNAERHVLAAMQTTSGVTAEQHHVYQHTGWIERDGEHVFAHAAGGIGANGPVEGIEVRLQERMRSFVLPPPGSPSAAGETIRATLDVVRVAPARIMIPLLAVALRVVIAPCDFAMHLAGGSGVFKTTVAALIQQFFGPRLGARELPGSWSSTANSLETLAFYAKDVVLVVDDYAPSGDRVARERLHQSAERVFRGQGNRSGRGRCAPDGTLLVTRWPRGVILSTGEETPRGASLRARFLTLQMQPGDVDLDALTQAQKDAEAGLYARAMAAYIQWIAPRRADLRGERDARVEELRRDFGADGRHRRFPGLAADLYFGVETFSKFATQSGHCLEHEVDALKRTAFDALAEATAAQDREQREAHPAARFIELLRSAISSGAAHVTAMDGCIPAARHEAWGWVSTTAVESGLAHGLTNWRPSGVHVGWIDGDDLYVDKDAALKAAQSIGSPTGDPIVVIARTLSRRLRDGMHLKSTDPDGKHIEVQRTLSGAKRRVLHLRADELMPRGDSDEAAS